MAKGEYSVIKLSASYQLFVQQSIFMANAYNMNLTGGKFNDSKARNAVKAIRLIVQGNTYKIDLTIR